MRFIPTRLMSRPQRKLQSERYGSHDHLARRRLTIASALAIGLLAAGCGSGTSGSDATPVIPKVNAALTVAVVPGMDTAPLFIAKSDGDFTESGLRVTIDQVGSVSAALAAVRQGKADIAAADYVSYFNAIEPAVTAGKKPGLSVVSDAYDCAAGVMQVLTTSKTITKAQDLRGKTIGTTAPPGMTVGVPVAAGGPGAKPFSLETLLTQTALTSQNVDQTTTKWLPLPSSGLITALRNHTVSAILVAEPDIYQAETTLGAVPVLDSCTGSTAGLPLNGYFTSSAFAGKNQAALDTFRAILQQEGATAQQQLAVRDQLAKQPTNLGVQAAAVVTLGGYPTTLNGAVLNRIVNLMVDSVMIPGFSADVNALIVP